MGGVISYITEEGEEHPIAYASPSLSAAEKTLLCDREGSIGHYVCNSQVRTVLVLVQSSFHLVDRP